MGRLGLSLCVEAVRLLLKGQSQQSTEAKSPVVQQTVTNRVSTSASPVPEMEMVFHLKRIAFIGGSKLRHTALCAQSEDPDRRVCLVPFAQLKLQSGSSQNIV